MLVYPGLEHCLSKLRSQLCWEEDATMASTLCLDLRMTWTSGVQWPGTRHQMMRSDNSSAPEAALLLQTSPLLSSTRD